MIIHARAYHVNRWANISLSHHRIK